MIRLIKVSSVKDIPLVSIKTSPEETSIPLIHLDTEPS